MRTIKLKSLVLVNFKGIRNLDIHFNDDVTIVGGDNGTGKTTIFDAFNWLLFGKDSDGRSDSNFSIKTIDSETGKPILRLDHSVTGVLDVDGNEVKLQRCYKEKWVKPRGTTEETLSNHVTEFYMNDVKLGTKREYEAEINSIISEDVFKMITNPFCFTSLKADEQKAMLLDMAGNVTDDEVAKLNPEYVELLAQLSGRPLVQFAKEVAAKKRACKDVLAVIPAQIETVMELMPEPEDWDKLEAELEEKKKLLAQYDAQISDKSNANKAEMERKVKIQREIGEKQMLLTNREYEIRTEAASKHNAETQKLQEIVIGIDNRNKELANVANSIVIAQNNIRGLENSVSDYEQKIHDLEFELKGMIEQYKSINAETLVYPEGAFVCPTCGRPLEEEDIESKKMEMQGNFNAEKAKRLKMNIDSGKAKRAVQDGFRESLANTKERIQAEIDNIEAAKRKQNHLIEDIEGLQKVLEEKKKDIPEVPPVEPLMEKDAVCIRIKNEIAELNNQLEMDVPVADLSELSMAKATLNDGIQELYKLLAKRDIIARANKETKSLEEKRTVNNQQLADLEKWEYTAMSFQKDKDARLLSKINGLFQYVSFSFVSEQLNGGEKLTCVCTVGGTPYPDVNSAGKINAGLDIINAICKCQGVTAPIFIDNSESINETLPSHSQIIKLEVTHDEQLTIK